MPGRRNLLSAASMFAAASLVSRAAPARPGQAACPAADDGSGIGDFITAMPKSEHHVHLEGTLEADLKFTLAKRNKIALPYKDAAALRRSYNFHDLPSFLAVYYEGFTVLLGEQDFYDLCTAYLTRAAAQNVLYTEMFFDPQQHIRRGIAFATFIGGFTRAQADAKRNLGIESQLIMCFMRDLSAESAMQTLEQSLPFKQHIVGVGLDSDEKNNPPIKFAAVFARARAEGFRLTMHCDINQVDTHEHIRQAIEVIGVERIDHGGNIIERPELVAEARRRGIGFTVCPCYGGWLKQPAGGRRNIVRGMLDAGLKVTVNSDDPAYFRSNYVAEAFTIAQGDASLSQQELITIARNGFDIAWIGTAQRRRYLDRLDRFAHERCRS
jgi:adenosine deaminase